MKLLRERHTEDR